MAWVDFFSFLVREETGAPRENLQSQVAITWNSGHVLHYFVEELGGRIDDHFASLTS